MAKLLSGTRVYGTANVDSVLVVGNITPVVSVSNTTGSLVVTGGVGISGNVYSGNHVITGTGSGITFVDGTIQTTAFTGSLVTAISIIQGVDATQNTNITAVQQVVAQNIFNPFLLAGM